MLHQGLAHLLKPLLLSHLSDGVLEDLLIFPVVDVGTFVVLVVVFFIHACIIPDQGLEVKEKREKTLDDHATGRKRKDRAEPVEDANQGMEGREHVVLHGGIIAYAVGAGQEVGQEIGES